MRIVEAGPLDEYVEELAQASSFDGIVGTTDP